MSGGFGSGDCEGAVGEVGDEVQAAAECLDVMGDGLDVDSSPRSIWDTLPGVTPMV